MKNILWTFIIFIYFSPITLSQPSISDKIFIFSETFGDPYNPAILLNAGAGNQSITWPEKFCKDLSERGYFVIRYDYRDTGLSSQIDYDKHPYTVLDLATDAIKILKKHHIQKATFVGFSMGGQLAQFMGAYFPRYATTLILIGTSTDFKPGFDGMEGKPHTEKLSPPEADYIELATKPRDWSTLTLEEKINQYTLIWKRLDGSPQDFDELFYRQQGREVYERTPLQSPYVAHSKAMKASFDLHQQAPDLIKTPTLIIHGEKDPVFPSDHGEDLKKRIQHSKLLRWDNFAHAISPRNFDRLIEAIDSFIQNNLRE